MILRGTEVLLVKRGREPFLGWWSLPGGVVETGELLKDAVRREMREETGLDVEPLDVVEVFESIGAEFHFVVIDYVCRLVGGTLRAGDDVTEAEWFERSALPDNLTAGAAGVIEKALASRCF